MTLFAIALFLVLLLFLGALYSGRKLRPKMLESQTERIELFRVPIWLRFIATFGIGIASVGVLTWLGIEVSQRHLRPEHQWLMAGIAVLAAVLCFMGAIDGAVSSIQLTRRRLRATSILSTRDFELSDLDRVICRYGHILARLRDGRLKRISGSMGWNSRAVRRIHEVILLNRVQERVQSRLSKGN